MMLPPIHKPSSSVSATESAKRRSSIDNPTGGHPDRHSDSAEYLADRVLRLERENQHFREELLHMQQLVSNNNQPPQPRDDSSLIKVSEDLQRLASAFNNKLQADASQQQRDQHKAALLFAEVTRLGHTVESLETTMRLLADNTRRKLRQQDDQLASLGQEASAIRSSSPPKYRIQDEKTLVQIEDIQQSTQWLKQSLAHLRSELEADRQSRWQREAELRTEAEARVASTADRMLSRLNVELLRSSDELARLHDHVLALERWIVGEHGKLKRVAMTLTNRVAAVATECGADAALWHTLLQQLDDDWRVQWALVHEAVGEVAGHVQRKVFALEEVVPMEVTARQRQHETLRRRLDAVAQAMGKVVDSESALARRVDALERHQLDKVDGDKVKNEATTGAEEGEGERRHEWRGELTRVVEEQIQQAKQEISNHMSELGALTARIDTLEQQRQQQQQAEGGNEDTAKDTSDRMEEQRIEWRGDIARTVDEHSLRLMEELTGRHNVVLDKIETVDSSHSEALASLQEWTLAHAHECRQCYAYFQWTLEDLRADEIVRAAVSAMVDHVVSQDDGGKY